MVTTASAATSRNYYPFGMSFDSNYGDDIKYLYNGKEIQEEPGHSDLIDRSDLSLRRIAGITGHSINTVRKIKELKEI